VNDTLIILTAQIAAGSVVGTKDSLVSNGGTSDNFIKSINWVHVANGTNNDAFKIQFNPIRDITL